MLLIQSQHKLSMTLARIDDYRHSFNGMEKDDEVKGDGNSYDFGARIYDPRVGRWLSIDPQSSRYPSQSPYSFVTNSPLKFIDPDGEKVIIPPGSQEEVMGYLKELGLEKAYRINRNDKLKVNRFWVLTHRGQIMSNTDRMAVYKGINKEIDRLLHTTYVHVVDESPWIVTRAKYDSYAGADEGPDLQHSEERWRKTTSGAGLTGEMTYYIVGNGNAVVQDPFPQEIPDGTYITSRTDVVIDPAYVASTPYEAEGGLTQVESSSATTFVHLLIDKPGDVKMENTARRLIFGDGAKQRSGNDTSKDQGDIKIGYPVPEGIVIELEKEKNSLKKN